MTFNYIKTQFKKIFYKSIVSLFDAVAHKIIPFALRFIFKPLSFVFKKIAKPTVFFIYQNHLALRKKLYNTYSRSKDLLPVHFLKKYSSTLSLVALLTFIVTNNLYAQTNAKQLLENESLIYHLVYGSIEQPEIIEEGYTRSTKNIHSVITQTTTSIESPQTVDEENTNNTINQLATTSTMAGGNTLIKPTITSDSPLEKQTLRDQIDSHIVEPGETLSSIAQLYGISINTILWENKLRSQHLIQPGQKLTILPTSGISHIVKPGESINRIARNYNIDAQKILSFNELQDSSLVSPGQRLIIPEGTPIFTAESRPTPTPSTPTKIAEVFTEPIPDTSPQAETTDGMIWPTPGRVITQYYSWRHTGLDIDGITGDPIYAVADGTIEVSGWNSGGYGFQVIVDHDNGIKSRYAHCSKLLLDVGDTVTKGDVVCLMGSTGRSTGSHLHFEIMINGVRRNPLAYVK